MFGRNKKASSKESAWTSKNYVEKFSENKESSQFNVSNEGIIASNIDATFNYTDYFHDDGIHARSQ